MLVAACSGDDTRDEGPDRFELIDAGYTPGGWAPSGGNGQVGGPKCTSPADVPGFTPRWTPATHQPLCTQEQIDEFGVCLATGFNGVTTAERCAPFRSGGSASACAACLATADTALVLGPIIDRSGVLELNVAGCLAIAEGKLDGSGCGGKYQAMEQCEEAACRAQCPLTDRTSLQLYDRCLLAAADDPQICKSYATAAKCASEVQDAGGRGAGCVNFRAFDDWYARIAPMFCLDTREEGARDAGREAAAHVTADAAVDAGRDASRDAEGDAARDAAGDAARDAAGDAARDAAGDAPRDGAHDAAHDVASDAARDAARDATRDGAHAYVD
jgi:hypothetical protein